jgi:hypothetical protein
MTNFPDFLKLSKASRKALLCAIPSADVLFKIEIPLISSSVFQSHL